MIMNVSYGATQTTMHRESRKLTEKALINELDYSDIEFPVSVKQ